MGVLALQSGGVRGRRVAWAIKAPPWRRPNPPPPPPPCPPPAPTPRGKSLALLAVILAAGRLTLDLQRALRVRAIADCTLVNLDLSSSWYHCCVRKTVWP